MPRGLDRRDPRPLPPAGWEGEVGDHDGLKGLPAIAWAPDEDFPRWAGGRGLKSPLKPGGRNCGHRTKTRLQIRLHERLRSNLRGLWQPRAAGLSGVERMRLMERAKPALGECRPRQEAASARASPRGLRGAAAAPSPRGTCSRAGQIPRAQRPFLKDVGHRGVHREPARGGVLRDLVRAVVRHGYAG